MPKGSITRSWIVAALMVSGAACGAPEEPTIPAQEETAGDLAAFCDAAIELDKTALGDEGPTDSQLDRFVDAAPADIKSDAEILAASAREYRSGNDDAALSDEVQEAADRFDAYIEDNCPDA